MQIQVKKLYNRLCLGNTAAKPQSTYGLHIKDEMTGTKYLVDTGAFCSVFPASRHETCTIDTDPIRLTAANGSSIPSHGTRDIRLHFGGRTYTWNFRLAQVTQPLLGADFLAHHHLLVDIAAQRIITSDTFVPTLLHSGPTSPAFSVSSIAEQPFQSLIMEYTDVFKPELHHQKHSATKLPKHGTHHHITTTGAPVYSRFRRLSPEKLAAAKSSFAEMERMGICSKSASPWASPLHMVPKPDGSWRPCGDYRRLNLITEPDHYPMPNIADLTNSIGKSCVFSKLDLLKGYFQVPVHPSDVPKTAIITPFGSYVFHYSTFGLKNSGATFQRMMDSIFGQLPNVIVYMDDLLVFSNSVTDHEQHLRSVLSLLRNNGLIVRPDKCVFAASAVDFLGHRIDSSGIRPLPSKVKAIEDYPVPTTVKELQAFLGMVNYYHRFIPNAAAHMSPLYAVLSKKPKDLIWTSSQQSAFVYTKHALAEAATLTHPQPNAPLTLTTDASSSAIGAVLETIIDGTPQPLSFYSRTLNKAERNYSTFDRELLAVHHAIRHFRHMLEGRTFTIQTDHRPLVTALKKSGDAWSARQQRHLSAIAESGGFLTYIPGSKNPVADALSRVNINDIQPGIDYGALAREQQQDPELEAYKTAVTNLRLKLISVDNVNVMCDISTSRPRPLVPATFRRRIFDIVHGLSHPSIRSTIKLIKSKFVWHTMAKDIREWARSCVACQRSKVHRHTKSSIKEFPQPHRRFSHIHVDVVGPLPASNGCRYLFTVIDRSTRWPEAIPMEYETAASCASALLHSWISRFGLPEHITSDRGSAFISGLWSSLANLLGVQLHYTTAYHPQSNGMVERYHRTLKASLMARCANPDWIYHLPWVLLGIRTTPKEGLHVSAAEMGYGQALVVPGEFFPSGGSGMQQNAELQAARWSAQQFSPCHPTRHNQRDSHIPPELLTSDYVFIRQDLVKPALSPPYKGPYHILQRSEKAYQIDISGRTDWVSIDRLKPAYIEPASFDTYTRSGRKSAPPNRLGL